MDFVVQTSGTTSSDPLATKQRAGVVATLGNQPDELSEGTLEKGAGLIDGLGDLCRRGRRDGRRRGRGHALVNGQLLQGRQRDGDAGAPSEAHAPPSGGGVHERDAPPLGGERHHR